MRTPDLRAPLEHLLEARSRELALACDAGGRIAWADGRAVRLLRCEPGAALRALAAPGTEAKVDELLERGRREEVDGWEVSLLVDGRPATLRFCAVPHEGGCALLGSLAPEEHGAALLQLNDALDEVVGLNRQVVRQKNELGRKHEELLRLNRELAESNRGVLALHAELEDKAEALRESAEVKGRLVSSVSHEFRTPLNSILALSDLLLSEVDGPLVSEQRKQVGYMRTSASELMYLVNDLLDLSKLEAGRAALRAEKFTLSDLLASMRGAMRPLVPADSPVELSFEASQDCELETDRGKLSQVLRNLVSNALKFTEQGSVRVEARVEPVGEPGAQLVFTVQDTGIGIAPENLERIFEEFTQLESHVQARVKGTGLGLSITRRLTELLGGTLGVESQLGRGSTFTVRIPLSHPEVREMAQVTERSRRAAPGLAPVLVVEDDRKTMFVYEKYLAMAGFQVLPARTLEEARATLQQVRPAAIVLDIMLEGEATWRFLSEVKQSPDTHDIPVLVVTVTNREEKARALGADEFWLKPLDQERLVRKLDTLVSARMRPARVLVIDDDERARYVTRKHLEGGPYVLFEAATGTEGVQLAQTEHPHVILLDFLLKGETAFDVLDELKANPRTRGIPVIVVTSHLLDDEERERLSHHTQGVISKHNLTRELAINRIRDALRKVGLAPAAVPSPAGRGKG